jgi:hypothetical protein
VYELPGSPVEISQQQVSPLPHRLLVTADDATDVYRVTSSFTYIEKFDDEEQTVFQGSVVFDKDHQLSVGPFRSPRAMSWWLERAETNS